MPLYSVGETVKSNLMIRDSTNTLVDPTNTPTFDLYDPNDIELLTAQNMTFESTGKYYYPVQTQDTWTKGKYRYRCKVVDGVLVSIIWGSFELGT